MEDSFDSVIFVWMYNSKNSKDVYKRQELHNALASSPKFPFYSAAYFKALPFIVELRNKNGKKDEPELDIIFLHASN